MIQVLLLWFYMVLFTYLTPQNKFLENLRKITISKNGVPKKPLDMALMSLTFCHYLKKYWRLDYGIFSFLYIFLSLKAGYLLE